MREITKYASGRITVKCRCGYFYDSDTGILDGCPKCGEKFVFGKKPDIALTTIIELEEEE